MYRSHLHGVPKARRRGHQMPWKWMIVSHHVVAGTQTEVHWKNSQCSELLRHLSSTIFLFMSLHGTCLMCYTCLWNKHTFILYYLFACVCLCVWVCVCVYVPVRVGEHVSMETRDPCWMVFTLFFETPPLHFWDWSHAQPLPAFYLDAGDLNLSRLGQHSLSCQLGSVSSVWDSLFLCILATSWITTNSSMASGYAVILAKTSPH